MSPQTSDNRTKTKDNRTQKPTQALNPLQWNTRMKTYRCPQNGLPKVGIMPKNSGKKCP